MKKIILLMSTPFIFIAAHKQVLTVGATIIGSEVHAQFSQQYRSADSACIYPGSWSGNLLYTVTDSLGSTGGKFTILVPKIQFTKFSGNTSNYLYPDANGIIKTGTLTAAATYTPGNRISITGTSPNYTVSVNKRQETYSASTATTGIVTVTYGTAYSVTPNVQPTMGLGATNKYTCTPITSTTTGCSYKVEGRNDVLGLLPSYTNISGLNVDFIVTEK